MKTDKAVIRARKLLEERKMELEAELGQIEQALQGLSDAGRSARRSRPARASTRPTTARRRRRRGGTRAEHALAHIGKHPGATASEIAGALGIKANYVYRVMGELEKDGLARKDGRGYHAVGAS